MTAQQIAQKLYDKGFDTKVVNNSVIVNLNRKVNTMEVDIALDREERMSMQSGNSVIVMGA